MATQPTIGPGPIVLRNAVVIRELQVGTHTFTIKTEIEPLSPTGRKHCAYDATDGRPLYMCSVTFEQLSERLRSNYADW